MGKKTTFMCKGTKSFRGRKKTFMGGGKIFDLPIKIRSWEGNLFNTSTMKNVYILNYLRKMKQVEPRAMSRFLEPTKPSCVTIGSPTTMAKLIWKL